MKPWPTLGKSMGTCKRPPMGLTFALGLKPKGVPLRKGIGEAQGFPLTGSGDECRNTF